MKLTLEKQNPNHMNARVHIKYNGDVIGMFETGAFRSCGSPTLHNISHHISIPDDAWEQFKTHLKTQDNNNLWFGGAGGVFWLPSRWVKTSATEGSLAWRILNDPNTKLLHSFKNRAHGSGQIMDLYVYHVLGDQNKVNSNS